MGRPPQSIEALEAQARDARADRGVVQRDDVREKINEEDHAPGKSLKR